MRIYQDYTCLYINFPVYAQFSTKRIKLSPNNHNLTQK